ncbi:MAG: PIN/TRAM domain-containing protein [Solirubrobacterales bacterium]
MFNKKTLVFLVLISSLVGVYAGYLSLHLLGLSAPFAWGIGLSGASIVFVLARQVFLMGLTGWTQFYSTLETSSIESVTGGVIGLLVGLLVGFSLSYPFRMLPGAGVYALFFLFFASGFLGMHVGRTRARDFLGLFPRALALPKRIASRVDTAKVLDTSAIIDGRIYDVALSGFLEGELVVPSFVIEELRHIADSSDYIRRSKGRRGLEILAKMQKNQSIKVKLLEGDYPEEREVDMKLLRICKNLNAAIITNDYNLNKVAELQGIKVLNVNELTNAVKVVVFPGETMRVAVIKEGKEEGQGVGYLEDGTMVVIEGGEEEIGQEVEVIVTSVFQTAAGRMIFSRKARENTRAAAAPVQKLHEVNLFG